MYLTILVKVVSLLSLFLSLPTPPSFFLHSTYISPNSSPLYNRSLLTFPSPRSSLHPPSPSSSPSPLTSINICIDLFLHPSSFLASNSPSPPTPPLSPYISPSQLCQHREKRDVVFVHHPIRIVEIANV